MTLIPLFRYIYTSGKEEAKKKRKILLDDMRRCKFSDFIETTADYRVGLGAGHGVYLLEAFLKTC
jgi:hypothetical protein